MKPSKGDQIKVIHKEDSFSEDYQNGDIFTVEDTWYGGVQVKTALGLPLALSESEYEPYRETPPDSLPEGEFAGKIFPRITRTAIFSPWRTPGTAACR